MKFHFKRGLLICLRTSEIILGDNKLLENSKNETPKVIQNGRVVESDLRSPFSDITTGKAALLCFDLATDLL